MEGRGAGWSHYERPCEEEEAEEVEKAEARADAAAVVEAGAAAAGLTPESDWSFIDCDMETVSLQDLPSALIACSLPLGVFFVDGPCRVGGLRGRGRARGWDWEAAGTAAGGVRAKVGPFLLSSLSRSRPWLYRREAFV